MRSDTLQIVTIGGFGHVLSVLDEIRDHPGVVVAACAAAYANEDITAVTAHPACGSARIFADYRQMLDTIKPDVAIISTRLDRIAEAAIEAAQHGCHLICEKPPALSAESLQQLYAAVTDANVNLAAMLSMKNKAAFRTARRLYQEDIVGGAVVLNVRKSYKWGQRPAWFAERRTYGDTFGWVGIHAFSLIYFVTGDLFTSLSAMESNLNHPDYPDCQDSAVVSGRLANGAAATISIDLFRPESAATWGDDWIRIVGTKGILEANADEKVCRMMTAGDTSFRAVTLEPEGSIYRDFLDTVRGGSIDAALRDEAFLLTWQCLCARDAAASGRRVCIEKEFESLNVLSTPNQRIVV